MYTVSVSQRNEHGQDVAAVLECEEHEIAKTAEAALVRLKQNLEDADALEALRAEEMTLRKALPEQQQTVDALERAGVSGEVLRTAKNTLASSVQRLEEVKKERAAIYARNA